MFHTCTIGPLCDEWPGEGPDDMRTGCGHGSCLAIVNDWGGCAECWARLSEELDEIDPPGPTCQGSVGTVSSDSDQIESRRFLEANSTPRTIILENL